MGDEMKSCRKVPHFQDISINFSNNDDMVKGCFDLVEKVRPDWKRSDFKTKTFTEGITNVLLGVYTKSKKDMVMVRMYGKNTEQIIDRKAELKNMMLLNDNGCGSTVYATFSNGLAYEFIPGDILTYEMAKDAKISQLVLEMMAKMHKMKLDDQQKPKSQLWDLIKKLYLASPDDDAFKNDTANSKCFKECKIMSKSKLWEELCMMEDRLKDEDCPVVFSHNDLLLPNIIYNKEANKVTFIDFEYGNHNYQPFDIANHFNEFAGVEDFDNFDKYYPDEAFQKDWIKRYLLAFNNVEQVSDDKVHHLFVQVQKFSLCSHLMWGIWSLVQAKNSTIDFDFIEYAMHRLNQYTKKKEKFMAMK